MPSAFLISLLALLVIIIDGGSAYPQTPPPVSQQRAPTDESSPQPEVVTQTSTIKVENNLLSVELVNADFGEIIKSIAQKARFGIEGYSDAFKTKVTTKFDNLEIDRGFARLFSLVKESNYLISYDAKGSISKLEIYGNAAAGSVHKSPTRTQISPARPSIRSPFPTSRPGSPRGPRPVARPLPSEQSQPSETSQPPQPPQPAPEDQMPEDEGAGHQDIPDQAVKEIPYIPPQKKPVYIPPIRR
jgi:hypothetical protein